MEYGKIYLVYCRNEIKIIQRVDENSSSSRRENGAGIEEAFDSSILYARIHTIP